MVEVRLATKIMFTKPCTCEKLNYFNMLGQNQCDQIKIAKCLLKLPKYDLTRKMIDFDTFTKLPKNVGDLGKLIVARGFKKLPKVQ